MVDSGNNLLQVKKVFRYLNINFVYIQKNTGRYIKHKCIFKLPGFIPSLLNRPLKQTKWNFLKYDSQMIAFGKTIFQDKTNHW